MIYQLIPRLCLRFVRAVCGARADKGYGEYYLVKLCRALCYLAANIFTLLLLVTRQVTPGAFYVLFPSVIVIK